MTPATEDNPAYAERFIREARTVATWRHEHIIQIYYADDEDGLFYFVMEYIDGPDLGQLIAQQSSQNKFIPQQEIIRLGQAVAQGSLGGVFGSPSYIAPEQAVSSAGAVPQSDLYAVGIIMDEIFVGKLPFQEEKPLDMARMHSNTSPPAPSQRACSSPTILLWQGGG